MPSCPPEPCSSPAAASRLPKGPNPRGIVTTDPRVAARTDVHRCPCLPTVSDRAARAAPSPDLEAFLHEGSQEYVACCHTPHSVLSWA